MLHHNGGNELKNFTAAVDCAVSPASYTVGVIGQADIVVHPSEDFEVANPELMRGSFSPSSSPVPLHGSPG